MPSLSSPPCKSKPELCLIRCHADGANFFFKLSPIKGTWGMRNWQQVAAIFDTRHCKSQLATAKNSRTHLAAEFASSGASVLGSPIFMTPISARHLCPIQDAQHDKARMHRAPRRRRCGPCIGRVGEVHGIVQTSQNKHDDACDCLAMPVAFLDTRGRVVTVMKRPF